MSTFVGVDGGLSGAIAIFCPEEAPLFQLRILKIPHITRKLSIKSRSEIDPTTLREELTQNFLDSFPRRILIEMGMGDRKQSSAFAYNYGFTNGAVYATFKLLAPTITDFVSPAVWKRSFGLIGKDKDASRAAAQQYFPAHAHLWETVSSHGRAEAALIAAYARETEYEHTLSASDPPPDRPRGSPGPRKRVLVPGKDRLVRLPP